MTKKIKVLKDFTYYSLIKEAIYSTRSMQATASEIFDYFILRYPTLFMASNSMTWKGNIRQSLSKNPEFIKMHKNGSTKEHFWSHRPMEVLKEEERKALENKSEIKEIRMEKYPNYMKQRRVNDEIRNEIENEAEDENEKINIREIEIINIRGAEI